jgi:hypothetical protein
MPRGSRPSRASTSKPTLALAHSAPRIVKINGNELEKRLNQPLSRGAGPRRKDLDYPAPGVRNSLGFLPWFSCGLSASTAIRFCSSLRHSPAGRTGIAHLLQIAGLLAARPGAPSAGVPRESPGALALRLDLLAVCVEFCTHKPPRPPLSQTRGPFRRNSDHDHSGIAITIARNR